MISSPAPDRKKNRKRLGRGDGSGKGTTAGRGTKGQNARSGGGVRPGFEGGQLPIQRRMPFKRGFTNRYKTPWEVVNLQDLEDAGFSDTVTPQALAEIGLIRGAEFPVKILAGGEFSTKLEVHAHGFSEKAKERIEAAGGTAIVVQRTDRWVTASPRSRQHPIDRDLKRVRLGKVGGIEKASDVADS